MQIKYKLPEILVLVLNKSTVRPLTGLANRFEGACPWEFSRAK